MQCAGQIQPGCMPINSKVDNEKIETLLAIRCRFSRVIKKQRFPGPSIPGNQKMTRPPAFSVLQRRHELPYLFRTPNKTAG